MPHVFEKEQRSGEPTETLDNDMEQDPLQVFIAWKAASRPFRQREKKYYTTIAAIAVLLILLAILMQYFLLVGAILSFTFVTYILGFTPPEEVEYKISSQGITAGNHFYFWADLASFWIIEKDGGRILNILTRLRFPGQLMVLIPEDKSEVIKRIVAKFLPYHEIPPQSFIERWGDRLQKYFPLEGSK